MNNLDLFARRINGKLPVLVDFYDNQDGTCRTMHTLLKIVAYRLEGKVNFISLDINASSNRKIIHQHLQKKAPIITLFYQGEIKWQASGLITSRRLIDIIKDQMVKLKILTEIN